MTNPIKQFLIDNLKEILLGLFVGIIIAILANLSLEQGLTLMVLAPLLAVILKQLISNIEFLKSNQQTTLVILALVASFFLFQQFNLGLFSIQELNTPVQAVNLPLKAITGISGAGLFSVLGIIFVILLRIPVVGIWLAPIFLGFLFIFLGIPILRVTGALISNFPLVIIVTGMVAIMFLLFQKQSVARTKELVLK